MAGEVIEEDLGVDEFVVDLEEEEVTGEEEQGIEVPGVEHTGSSAHALHTVDRTGLRPSP